ncbi:hypothetical protein TTHERM_00703950 (macronuclear) [Tetrahymena thermophila SB210]|uniref:Uncharacterized protein n=1 Tax=Tetrahymena thermophila (strain SB210) TaxID=312017 RepID=Q22GC8_TETTS|nr:hypothetical protein TTHERM_00703950 [Tetrahymena thermophila SB210]EAR84403.2 hypothetical protein TTHERM_00703950 [Tetrahymena thermophila SB210]|eukprot:XP_001032066.2 hypothetical protein TTHERM_00703950 [Tetrahymena thermophila SB210]
MNNLQGNISNNNPDPNYGPTSSTGQHQSSEGYSNKAVGGSTMRNSLQSQQTQSSVGSMMMHSNQSNNSNNSQGDYLKNSMSNNNSNNSLNQNYQGSSVGQQSSVRRGSSNQNMMGYASNSGNQQNQQKQSQQHLSTQSQQMYKDDDGGSNLNSHSTGKVSQNNHHQHSLSMQQNSQQLSQSMDVEKSESHQSQQFQSQQQQNSNLGSANPASGPSQSGQGASSSAQGGSGSQSAQANSATGNKTPAINRLEAQDVIINFKKHLLDKWKKNKAKQHVNKIIHYHVQHTFFLRYAAPLFLKDYQELLNTNLQQAGQNNNNREQGLISTLKQINQDILNGSKKTKSVDVLQSYLTKLDEKDQLNQFLEVLVFILFGEIPYQIPLELNERKKNLFHYVSPIIAFLIIFYIHAEKKPQTLDELVTRSGLKQLYKNIKVPCKDVDPDDPNAANANDSDEDEDDEMIDEEGDSAQQNSGQNNIQNTASKQQPSNTSQQQSSSQQKNAPGSQVGSTGSVPSLKKKNSQHPASESMKEEDDDQQNQDDKQSQQSGMRSTPQFLDLEKTLQQQKQQLSQQVLNQQQNIYNPQGNTNMIQKRNPMSGSGSGSLMSGSLSQSGQQPNGMIHTSSSQSMHHHHHHHHHHQMHSMNQNNPSNQSNNPGGMNKGMSSSSYQPQQSQSKQHYYSNNNKNINTDNDEYDEDTTQHDLSSLTNQSTYPSQNTPPNNYRSNNQNSNSSTFPHEYPPPQHKHFNFNSQANLNSSSQQQLQQYQRQISSQSFSEQTNNFNSVSINQRNPQFQQNQQIPPPKGNQPYTHQQRNEQNYQESRYPVQRFSSNSASNLQSDNQISIPYSNQQQQQQNTLSQKPNFSQSMIQQNQSKEYIASNRPASGSFQGAQQQYINSIKQQENSGIENYNNSSINSQYYQQQTQQLIQRNQNAIRNDSQSNPSMVGRDSQSSNINRNSYQTNQQIQFRKV